MRGIQNQACWFKRVCKHARCKKAPYVGKDVVIDCEMKSIVCQWRSTVHWCAQIIDVVVSVGTDAGSGGRLGLLVLLFPVFRWRSYFVWCRLVVLPIFCSFVTWRNWIICYFFFLVIHVLLCCLWLFGKRVCARISWWCKSFFLLTGGFTLVSKSPYSWTVDRLCGATLGMYGGQRWVICCRRWTLRTREKTGRMRAARWHKSSLRRHFP